MQYVTATAFYLLLCLSTIASPAIDDDLKESVSEADLALLVTFAREQFQRELGELVLTRCGAPVGNMCVLASFQEISLGNDIYEFATGTFYFDDWIERPWDVEGAIIKRGKWRTDGELHRYRMARFALPVGYAFIYERDDTAPTALIRRILDAVYDGDYDISFSSEHDEYDAILRQTPDDEWRRTIKAMDIKHVSVEADGTYLLTSQPSKYHLGWRSLQFRETGGRLILTSVSDVRI